MESAFFKPAFSDFYKFFNLRSKPAHRELAAQVGLFKFFTQII
jgi:hypothetical protein